SLLDVDPLFTSMIRRCDEALREEIDWSIESMLRGREKRIDDTAVAQPLLVAIQLALTQVWCALGVEPAAVVGHSVGEVSAAVTAKMLDFRTGLWLAARRGRSMAAGGGEGRMLAVGLGQSEAEAHVKHH